MKKRNLFAELKDGMEALTAEREGKTMIERPIESKAEYDHAVMVMNALLDAGGADENNRLAALVDNLGEVISAYESSHGH